MDCEYHFHDDLLQIIFIFYFSTQKSVTGICHFFPNLGDNSFKFGKLLKKKSKNEDKVNF